MINRNENNGTAEQNKSYIEMPPGVGLMSESLVRIIWRSRWIVLLATVAALGAAFVYIAKATPIYTSTSRIYVEQSGPKILTEAEGIMTQSKNYLYTQAELLRSTPILSSTLDTPGVRRMKIFDSIDNPIAYLKKGLEVSVGKKDDIISISSDSPEPVEAAQLVNTIVDSYITYHATRKRSTTGEVLKILQTEKIKRDEELIQKLKAMMNYKKENTALAFESSRGNVILNMLERLSEAVTQAQFQTLETKAVYEIMKSMETDPTRLKQFVETEKAKGWYSSTANERTRLMTELDRLQLQIGDLGRQVTPGHPSMQALQSKIDKVDKQLDDFDRQFAEDQLAIAEQQYLAAKEKEEHIFSYFEEHRQEAISLNEQLAQYTILQSDWEQTKKLCDILFDRIKEINVTEDVGALNISILEAAHRADKPSSPQKARIMAIALVLGLMLGGGLALLRDWMDQKLHSAEEISAVLGMPVLGIVPSMSKRQSVASRGQKVQQDSHSPWAEAYRTIRTAVFFGVPKDEAKTILVTSPAAGDGKTTLVSNLGIAMAQAGQKTLILDADFRKLMQHKIFEVSNNDKGLSNVLAENMTLEKVIRQTTVRGLELLTCGPEVPNPSEILNSESFAKLLKLLSSKYDRVIIDSPPVMPVTDSQILSAICDITLLVLRAEKSTRKLSRQARDGLISVGAHILGAIVNDVSKKSDYGYYGGYGYYNHPHHRKKKDTEDKKLTVVVERAKR
ncbi:MAG: polysaccharide biosynthesis tyrosine autokinase [Planctomycetes bacterium]|nr:polysaccharide biosynthesis tyrosine autokinase [Planctomycetota bacterium]